MEPFTREIAVAQSAKGSLSVSVELDAGGQLHVTAEARTVAGGGECFGQLQDHIEADAARIAAEPRGRRQLGEADLSALVAIWRRWHGNHMRPGCEHQTGPDWDASERIETVLFSVDWNDRRQLERERDAEAEGLGLTPDTPRPVGSPAPRYGPVPPHVQADFRKWSSAAERLAALAAAGVEPFAWRAVRPAGVVSLGKLFEIIPEAELSSYRSACEIANLTGGGYRWNGRTLGRFGVRTKPPLLRRVKSDARGWVKHTDHPRGLLCKPCPTCGYKYGSAWLKEEIPADVLAELDRITRGRPAPESPDSVLAGYGLALEVERVDKRPNGDGSSWAHDSRHFRCKLTKGRRSMSFHFSQGSGHTADPTLSDVFDCLRSDYQMAGDEDNAAELKLKPSQWAKVQRQAQQFRALVGDDAEALGVVR